MMDDWRQDWVGPYPLESARYPLITTAQQWAVGEGRQGLYEAWLWLDARGELYPAGTYFVTVAGGPREWGNGELLQAMADDECLWVLSVDEAELWGLGVADLAKDAATADMPDWVEPVPCASIHVDAHLYVGGGLTAALFADPLCQVVPAGGVHYDGEPIDRGGFFVAWQHAVHDWTGGAILNAPDALVLPVEEAFQLGHCLVRIVARARSTCYDDLAEILQPLGHHVLDCPRDGYAFQVAVWAFRDLPGAVTGAGERLFVCDPDRVELTGLQVLHALRQPDPTMIVVHEVDVANYADRLRALASLGGGVYREDDHDPRDDDVEYSDVLSPAFGLVFDGAVPSTAYLFVDPTVEPDPHHRTLLGVRPGQETWEDEDLDPEDDELVILLDNTGDPSEAVAFANAWEQLWAATA